MPLLNSKYCLKCKQLVLALDKVTCHLCDCPVHSAQACSGLSQTEFVEFKNDRDIRYVCSFCHENRSFTLNRIENLISQEIDSVKKILADLERKVNSINPGTTLSESSTEFFDRPSTASNNILYNFKTDKDEAQADDNDEDFYNKVRETVQEFTRKKIKNINKKFKHFHINSLERLEGVVGLIYDEAVENPVFSNRFAQLCKRLANLKVGDNNGQQQGANRQEKQKNVQPKSTPIKFRKLLITRCQQEFKTNKKLKMDIEKKQQAINETSDPDKKKELQLLFDEEKRKIRMRSVGLVTFMGELFKKKMLTTNIMKNCIKQLLSKADVDSLVCLCKLLTTIGKEFESQVTLNSSDKKAAAGGSKSMEDDVEEDMMVANKNEEDMRKNSSQEDEDSGDAASQVIAPPSQPSLKYNYKDGHWSPLNPEGKKVYDHKILMKLREDPLSAKKPNITTDLKIFHKEDQIGVGGGGGVRRPGTSSHSQHGGYPAFGSSGSMRGAGNNSIFPDVLNRSMSQSNHQYTAYLQPRHPYSACSEGAGGGTGAGVQPSQPTALFGKELLQPSQAQLQNKKKGSRIVRIPIINPDTGMEINIEEYAVAGGGQGGSGTQIQDHSGSSGHPHLHHSTSNQVSNKDYVAEISAGFAKLAAMINPVIEQQASQELNDYFREMERLSKKFEGSNVSSMLRDVIQLRQNHWVPIKNVNKPKKSV